MPVIALVFLVIFLVIFLQLGMFSIVLAKLGLSPHSATILLSTTILGSMINLPLFSMQTTGETVTENLKIPRLLFSQVQPFNGKTIVALNVGGALVPVFFSLYLIQSHALSLLHIVPAVMIVTLISYSFSRPIKGLGIGMPVFIAPITAAITALLIAPTQSAPVAYVCGTLGVLIGADLLRLKEIKHMGVPVASIGGAGTFDGIFFTGIIAALLA